MVDFVAKNLPENPAKVRVSLGVTKALPNEFEFLRCDVAIEVPCALEDIDETHRKCTTWVSGKLESELARNLR